MKKVKIKNILITISVLGILAVGFRFVCPVLYYYVYPWDRIRGNININIDKHSIALEEENMHVISFPQGSFSKNYDKYKARSKKDDTLNVGIKAGQYGRYTFGVDVPDLDKTIQITVWQNNRWNVTTFDLDIDIDKNNDSILYTYSYTYLSEDGKTLHDNDTMKNSVSDDEFNVFLGG